jgi:hypothetical protein
MITPEVVEFFGVTDPVKRTDLVEYFGVMVSIAEGRREALKTFFSTLGSRTAEYNIIRQDLERTQEMYKNTIAKLEFTQCELRKSNQLLGTTNAASMEVQSKYKKQKEEYAHLALRFAAAENISSGLEKDLLAANENNAKLAAQVKEQAAMISKLKAEEEIVVTKKRKAVEAFRSAQKEVAADDAHTDDSVMRKCERLRVENVRLQALVEEMASIEDDLPPPPAVKKADANRRRTATDDGGAVRKQVDQLRKELQLLMAESKAARVQHEEGIKAVEALLHEEGKAKAALQTEVDGLKSEVAALKEPPPAANKDLEAMLMNKILVEQEEVKRLRRCSSFMITENQIMDCPVIIRTGFILPLMDVFTFWRNNPCDNEGTYYASFPCPRTRKITSLAPTEIVVCMYRVAMDLELRMTPPFKFQYNAEGQWMDFDFIDQISITSLCCKIYRHGVTDASEVILVCYNNGCQFKFKLVDNVVHMAMGFITASMETCYTCTVHGPVQFFERWKFAERDTPAVNPGP